MLDEYIYGDTNRKNPESPMPLLRVAYEEVRLGGAANVANNLASLSSSSRLMGMIGRDSNGRHFEDICRESHIQLFPILSDSPTIVKRRFLDSQYKLQLLRVDYERPMSLDPSKLAYISDTLGSLESPYIIVSDYNKGMISKDLVDVLTLSGKKILLDVKPENIDHFHGVYLIKPNFKEFSKMIGHESIKNIDQDIALYGKEFVKKYATNLVVTRGEHGSSLITQSGEVCHIPPTEVHKVFDVTGAGDTFIATLAYALDSGYCLVDAVRLANKASGIVVGKVGTAVVTKEELGI